MHLNTERFPTGPTVARAPKKVGAAIDSGGLFFIHTILPFPFLPPPFREAPLFLPVAAKKNPRPGECPTVPGASRVREQTISIRMK